MDPRRSADTDLPDPTLLVIEDARDSEALVRVAARSAFPALDVRVAGDGEEGIAYLGGSPPFQERSCHRYPHLVILDLIMPKIDGFGVLEWIGSQGSQRLVPVVVLTASTDPEHQRRAIALGADAVFIKPAGPAELTDAVKAIVLKWIGPLGGASELQPFARTASEGPCGLL